jgi:hypothetical protein
MINRELHAVILEDGSAELAKENTQSLCKAFDNST